MAPQHTPAAAWQRRPSALPLLGLAVVATLAAAMLMPSPVMAQRQPADFTPAQGAPADVPPAAADGAAGPEPGAPTTTPGVRKTIAGKLDNPAIGAPGKAAPAAPITPPAAGAAAPGAVVPGAAPGKPAAAGAAGASATAGAAAPLRPAAAVTGSGAGPEDDGEGASEEPVGPVAVARPGAGMSAAMASRMGMGRVNAAANASLDGGSDVSPNAPKLAVRKVNCTDVAPGTRHTCEEQRMFNKCESEYMITYAYCSKTCGHKPCPVCDDKPPNKDYNCTQQAKFGKCSESWMAKGNYCARSCGRLPCPPLEADRKNFTSTYARRNGVVGIRPARTAGTISAAAADALDGAMGMGPKPAGAAGTAGPANAAAPTITALSGP